MAVIQFSDGKKRKVTHDVALSIRKILTGQLEPDGAQAKYCERIQHVWLDWRSAPDEYIKEKFDVIVQLHFGDWMCDRNGILTLPDYSRVQAWEFAKHWGLVERGKVTEVGEYHLRKYQPERSAVRVFNEPARKDVW